MSTSFGVEIQLTVSSFLNLGNRIEQKKKLDTERASQISFQDIEDTVDSYLKIRPEDPKLIVLKAEVVALKLLFQKNLELKGKSNLTISENAQLILASSSLSGLKKSLVNYVLSSKESVETEKIKVINSPTSIEVINLILFYYY